MNKHRDNLDKYFMEICDKVAQRSTCRVKLGCLIVKNKNIVGLGYVGSLSGDLHCEDVGCNLVNNNGLYGSSDTGKSCIRTIHAEQNAVIKCHDRGGAYWNGPMGKTDWMTCYSSYSPCVHCLKLLLSIGVRNFIYRKEYADINREHYLNALLENIRNTIHFKMQGV